MKRLPVLVAAAALFLPQRIDSRLASFVDAIRAIDDHAHVVAPDMEHDTGYDALPCDLLPGGSLPPANVRFGPDVLAAWKMLYGFSGKSDEAADLRAAAQAQADRHRREGEKYFQWVLDQAGIEIVMANRLTMPAQLTGPRFVWVPYDDALLFPLDNTVEKTQTPDRRIFLEREELLLKTYLQQAGLTEVPTSFDQYLNFVSGVLTRQKSGSAAAIKFEAAYLRSLDFAPADRETASAIYGRARAAGALSAADYKTVQDFLFRAIAREAGRLGMAVQIHTGDGCGDYFDQQGAAPMLLSSVVNDPGLRDTNFVLLHGGSPNERSIAALIKKPNVYADMSAMELLWSPAELARALRPWLEIAPEHVLFGTDAGPFGPGLGWEETTWLGSRNTRRAITLALTQMVDDRAITADRAREIATRVLRTNAAELYRLGNR